MREELILLQWLSSILGNNIGRARDQTSGLLFSSPVRYPLSYGARLVKGENTMLWRVKANRKTNSSKRWFSTINHIFPKQYTVKPVLETTCINLYSINTHFDAYTTDSFWKQFLLFPQCFLLNQKIVSSSVNIFDIISLFDAELEEPRTGIWGKGLRDHLL